MQIKQQELETHVISQQISNKNSVNVTPLKLASKCLSKSQIKGPEISGGQDTFRLHEESDKAI